jgi:hypothetical protein
MRTARCRLLCAKIKTQDETAKTTMSVKARSAMMADAMEAQLM